MNPIDRTLDRILKERIILCVRMGDEDAVLAACLAAIRGGLRILEITLTTPGALRVIESLRAEFPDALVGAGTVLRTGDVHRVASSGAQFAMSPATDAGVVEAAHELDLLAVPGAATPTEILSAHRAGARLVKIFPAGALGGPDFLRAVRGPLPDVRFVPTSGPRSENFGAYLEAGAVAVGVGGEVFPPGFTLSGVEEAARRVRAAMDALPRTGHS